jgi:quinol monooxygenase YgiN
MMLLLRDVADSDLDVFFEHWADDDALRMAAFTPADAHDRAAFEARWARQRTTATILA